MVIYSINDLEKLSGVKAHTIRIWEKRYNIITPRRTKTNIRYYQDDDLKHILNIAFLNRKGMKISKIAKMSDAEIKKRVAELSDVSEAFEDQLDALTLSLIEMNEYKFDKIFDANVREKGFRDTMLDMIYPLLDKLNLMWMTGSINKAHEHFVINILRRKTIAAIDELNILEFDQGKSFLIYLPAGENHELSLLFLHYIIKELGNPVINLGLGVEIEVLKDAYDMTKPDYILSLVNDSHQKQLSTYLDRVKMLCPTSKLIFSGIQLAKQSIKSDEQLVIANGVLDLINILSDKPKTNVALRKTAQSKR